MDPIVYLKASLRFGDCCDDDNFFGLWSITKRKLANILWAFTSKLEDAKFSINQIDSDPSWL
jgi:hypothetical protein